MELTALTTEEIREKIGELNNKCVPIYAEIKPLERELCHREQFDYVGKYFVERREAYPIFTHVKSVKVGEYGLQGVVVDKIALYRSSIAVSKNIEEYNYRYLGVECGKQEWNDAVLRARDFMEEM